MIQISLIKPFARIKEGVRYTPCFLAFGREATAWSQGFSTEEEGTEGIRVQTIKTVQHSYRLYINLYFVELYFSWKFSKLKR